MSDGAVPSADGQPDVLRGVTGLVVPDRAPLLDRLTQMRKPLEGSKFDFRESNDGRRDVCPGAIASPCTIRREPFRPHRVGMPYMSSTYGGHGDRIAGSSARSWGRWRPWSRTAAAARRACRWRDSSWYSARPTAGKPTTATTQIYIRFLRSYQRLTRLARQHGSERPRVPFKDIHTRQREVLFTVEHECAARLIALWPAVVNRNPAQSTATTSRARAMSWAMA